MASVLLNPTAVDSMAQTDNAAGALALEMNYGGQVLPRQPFMNFFVPTAPCISSCAPRLDPCCSLQPSDCSCILAPSRCRPASAGLHRQRWRAGKQASGCSQGCRLFVVFSATRHQVTVILLFSPPGPTPAPCKPFPGHASSQLTAKRWSTFNPKGSASDGPCVDRGPGSRFWCAHVRHW